MVRLRQIEEPELRRIVITSRAWVGLIGILVIASIWVSSAASLILTAFALINVVALLVWLRRQRPRWLYLRELLDGGTQSGAALPPLTRRVVVARLSISATFIGVFVVARLTGVSFDTAEPLLAGAAVPLLGLAWRIRQDRRTPRGPRTEIPVPSKSPAKTRSERILRRIAGKNYPM